MSNPNRAYTETPVIGIRPLDLEDIEKAKAQSSMMADVERERQRFASLVKQRLGSVEVTEVEARDGLRDCFVASYLGGVAQGLENFSLRGDVTQVERVVEAIFRRRLKAHGTDWNAPSVDGLQAIKDEIDVEIHLDALPAELKSVHDQVCTLLLGKARGDIGHVGNRSAVAAHARGEIPLPAKSVSTPPAPAAPVPAAPSLASASPAAASPVAPPQVPMGTADGDGSDPVVTQMRLTVATLLEQIAREARAGASVDALFERAGQLTGLIETLRQLSPAAV